MHRQIEAVKLAFTDGLKYIADPAYMSVGSKELLSPEYASARRALIKKNAIVSQPAASATMARYTSLQPTERAIWYRIYKATT